MKKILTTMVLLLAAGLSYAQTGGFAGESAAKFANANEIKSLKDGSFVTLKGNILSKTGDEEYLFKDNSGTVTVEIDDEDWGGLVVKPEDTVTLEGEVDKDLTNVKVEVNKINLAQ